MSLTAPAAWKDKPHAPANKMLLAILEVGVASCLLVVATVYRDLASSGFSTTQVAAGALVAIGVAICLALALSHAMIKQLNRQRKVLSY